MRVLLRFAVYACSVPFYRASQPAARSHVPPRDHMFQLYEANVMDVMSEIAMFTCSSYSAQLTCDLARSSSIKFYHA